MKILHIAFTVNLDTLKKKYLRYCSDYEMSDYHLDRLVVCQGPQFNESIIKSLESSYPRIRFTIDNKYYGKPIAEVKLCLIKKYGALYDKIFLTDDDFIFSTRGLDSMMATAWKMCDSKQVGLINFRFKGANKDSDIQHYIDNPFSISTCSGILIKNKAFLEGMELLESMIPLEELLAVDFHEEAIIAMAIYLKGYILLSQDSSIRHDRSKISGIELKLKQEGKINSSNHFKRLAEKYNLYRKFSGNYYPANGSQSQLAITIHEENNKCLNI